MADDDYSAGTRFAELLQDVLIEVRRSTPRDVKEAEERVAVALDSHALALSPDVVGALARACLPGPPD